MRERLRSVFGRSPNEVEEELQRDKGYGGQKRKKCIVLSEREKNSTKVLFSDEDMRSGSPGRDSDGRSSDTSSGHQYKRKATHVTEVRISHRSHIVVWKRL